MFDDKGMTACLTCLYGDSAVDSKRCVKCIGEYVKSGINGKYYVKEGDKSDCTVFRHTWFWKVLAHCKNYFNAFVTQRALHL